MKSRKFRLLALFLLGALWAPLFAQEAPPETSAEEPPLYVLVTDERGVWDPEQQVRFKPPLSLGEGSGLSTDWKALVNTRPFRFLAFPQRVALMRHPQRLLSSTWASQYFTARHILVLRPVEGGRIVGRLYDVETGRQETIAVSAEGEQGGEAREGAMSSAAELAETTTKPVAAHPESGMYHHREAAHLSPRVTYTPLPTAQRAEIHGFRACRICYPETDRNSLYDDIDRKLGVYVARSIEGRFRLAAAGPESERVERIGRRLLEENRFLDRGYKFLLLDSDTINAFAAPTGPIYVTTGMLDILESDDELAAVLGHELSHSERRHARRQYERSREAGVVGLLVTVATGIPWARLGSDILATILFRGYSRGNELEADRDGMMMAYAAGYVPDDFLLVQEKLKQLQEQSNRKGPGWLRTHPRGEKRIDQLLELLEKTESRRRDLESLEEQDPGLSTHLKGKVLEHLEQAGELDDYLAVYRELLRRVEASSLEASEDGDS